MNFQLGLKNSCFLYIKRSWGYGVKEKEDQAYNCDWGGQDDGWRTFLVSGCGLACQQEILLVLPKTPPIHYGIVMDSAFSNYAG